MSYVWMLVGSVAFALMAILAESIRDQFTFPWITFARSGIAMILAILLAVAYKAPLVFFRPLTLWFRSLSGWASMICGFYAMTHYNIAVVLALTNTYPIWVAILAWPMLGVLPSFRTWIALFISFLGICLVYLNAAAAPVITPNETPALSVALSVIAAVLSGVALLNLHKLKQLKAQAIVAHFSGVAAACSLIVWVIIPVESPIHSINVYGVYSLIGIGVAATIGQLCLTKAFSTGEPEKVSVVGLSQVVVAALYKWIFHGEVPSSYGLVGMLLVLLGTMIVMLQPQKLPAAADELSSHTN